MIDCALFEPDIAQNAGTILRLGACFGARVHIIHPAGFVLSDHHFKRAGMDYLSRADLTEHDDWIAFDAWRQSAGRRLVALSTHGSTRITDFAFGTDDVLLFGRESAGLPESVRNSAAAVVRIPIGAGNRSLNVAAAAAIAVFEALRQAGGMPA
jgi:tRNA (cytidine/uridine-2'-O-)-methyltransferase